MKITREVILEGIIRHTVDARIRLEDGVSLFEQVRFSSAIILGTIALEDLGRAYWLASLADDEPRREQLTVKSFATALRKLDHQQNLKLGLAGFSMDHAPSINKETLQRQHGDDWEKALQRNADAIRSFHRKAPVMLHEARTTAQYPELIETGCSWKSSAEVSVETARNTLRQALENYYLFQTSRLDKLIGLRELSKVLGSEDCTFGYFLPYDRLGML